MPQALEQAGVSWKVYNNRDLGPINRVLFDGLVGSFKQAADPKSKLRANGIAPTYPLHFAADVAADKLPQVSWVVPPLLECEHPALPVALGAVGIVNVLRILLSNPRVWEKTALIVSWDENGGFFDHVTPPTARPNTPGEYIAESIVNNVSGSGGISGPIGLGYRVPCLVISPYSRGGRVDFSTFDPSRPPLGRPVLQAIRRVPQCGLNVIAGTLNMGEPYPVPYPQRMPVQESGPPT
jgi:phospholipase C